MTLLDYFAIAEPDAYGTQGATEIINVARTTSYMLAGLRPTSFVNINQCGCDVGDLGAAPLAGWRTPAIDNAPWYDPVIPESRLFAGILPNSVEGLDGNPVERTVTRVIGGGAILGALQATEREVTFSVDLIGGSCCAVAYGLRWLTAVLNRQCAAVGCDESDLVYLAACRNSAADCAPYVNETRSQIRTLTRVGLLKGPDVVDRRGQGCGQCGQNATITVEFTLVAGNPRVFGAAAVALNWTPLKPAVNDGCDDATWRCGPPATCAPEFDVNDPSCSGALPPPAPIPPPGCFCDPIAVHPQTHDLSTVTSPEWGASVLSIQLLTAAAPLRHVAFRLFRRVGGTCETDYPDCDALAALAVSYVPANSILTVDGVRRRTFVTAQDGSRFTAAQLTSAAPGSTNQWLDMDCGGSYCLSIKADAFNTPATAQVRAVTTLREG